MPARKNLLHSERVRERIRDSQLVNRLLDFVDGKIVLDGAQVTAALGLLRKAIPDLQAIEHTGEVKTVTVVSPEPMSEAQWQETYGGQRLNG